MVYWTRSAVVTEALSWIGTRFHRGQCVKGIGCDCIGLIGGVALELGMPSGRAWLNDPATKGYGAIPDPDVLHAACERHLEPIEHSDAGLGDVLVLRWKEQPHHFAIVAAADPLRVVHCYASARKVCLTAMDALWRNGTTWRSLIVSAWRYRELKV